jgi:hypothetical protein
MTNQNNTQPSSDKQFSEAAMDGLLRDFFRLEVPAALQGSSAVRTNSAAMAPVMVDHRPSAASRIVIVATLATLGACLLLSVNSEPAAPQGSGIATRVESLTFPQELMPVSSAPDSKAAGVPIDENGLLLKETEEIQLNPQP